MPDKATVDDDRRTTTSGALRLQPMPMSERRGGGSDITLIVGELEANLAEIMHLAFGQRLHCEDRIAIQQPEQPVPLAVVVNKRLGHPQLAAAGISGESGLSVEFEQFRGLVAPQSSHPFR